MFVVTVTFEIAADQAAAFLTRVCLQASDSLSNEDGCHRFDVCVDRERTERVFLYEIYADAAAFEEHMATPHFKAFTQPPHDSCRNRHRRVTRVGISALLRRPMRRDVPPVGPSIRTWRRAWRAMLSCSAKPVVPRRRRKPRE